MNNKFVSLMFFGRKINRQHVQMALVIITLAMLLLGAGAPTDGGGGW